jgi:hypothetical protein
MRAPGELRPSRPVCEILILLSTLERRIPPSEGMPTAFKGLMPTSEEVFPQPSPLVPSANETELGNFPTMSYVSYHAQWARRILRHRLAKEIPLALRQSNRDLFGGGLPAPGVDTPFDPDNLPELSAPLESLEGPDEKLEVCIIGAGVAGLYIAMILDDLAIPGLSYEILESSPDRTGGRLYTYRFKDEPHSPHDYFDIGAMRYPKASLPISHPAIR